MDIRENVARYYDLSPDFPADVPFYERRIRSPDARVLELGCGTGRVLLPLVQKCACIVGVDSSEAMLSVCRRKLAERGIPPSKARVHLGSVTTVRLGETFDLITSPFRVFQNLATDGEIDGFFDVIRTHLSADGTAIVNAFRPNLPADRIRDEWCSEDERFAWEVPVEGGTVTLHDRRPRIDRDALVLRPELIWRRYERERLVDEAVLSIPMRCHYAEDLVRLVTDHGFRVLETWGGYAGEPYGVGPELVLEFAADGPRQPR